jgi:hypothetical protein
VLLRVQNLYTYNTLFLNIFLLFNDEPLAGNTPFEIEVFLSVRKDFIDAA